MRIYTRQEKNSFFIIDLIDVESWEDFEEVTLKTIEEFSGKITSQFDGPEGSRKWVVVFDGIQLNFEFVDMLCMTIKSIHLQSEKIIQDIISYLENYEL